MLRFHCAGHPLWIDVRGQSQTVVDATAKHIPNPYYTIVYYTIVYYIILHYSILYYTILYYTILYYTILYYTILYYTILYYTILYYTTLYYTILYYAILSNPQQSPTDLDKHWISGFGATLLRASGLPAEVS